MNIVIFDTETVGLNKPFCYNIGYIIADIETGEILRKREFIVEQIWDNLPLFETAYYAEKRPLYVSSMRGKKAKMMKYGFICQQMRRDFREYEVISAYAYNSNFDVRVFKFNCDWYKCMNPFDEIPVFDIRGYVHNFMMTDDYKEFCEEQELFTEAGNYSTTAEAVYRYMKNDIEFKEAHTALADSEIEFEILQHCIILGADLNVPYQTFQSIERWTDKELNIVIDKEETHTFTYKKKVNKGDTIYLQTTTKPKRTKKKSK